MRKNPSTILAAVHATAKGLHKAGVMELGRLREFDCLCLPPVTQSRPNKSAKTGWRASDCVGDERKD